MRRAKNFLSAILALTLVISLTSALGITAAATSDTALNFTSELTPSEGNGYIWDAGNKKLTLYGVDISVTSGSAITLPGGATIELIGYNKVASDSATSSDCAITSAGELTLGGSGVLEVSAAAGSALAADSLIINGGYITVSKTEGEAAIGAKTAIAVDGGYVVASNTNGTAIGPIESAPSLTYTQSGGYVKATGTVDAVGASCATVSGGYLEAGGGLNGIHGDVINSGGVVKASGNSYGVDGAFEANGGVTILHGGTFPAVKNTIQLTNNEQGYIIGETGTLADTGADIVSNATSAEKHLVFAREVYNTARRDLPAINGTYIMAANGNALTATTDTLEITGGSYLESTNTAYMATGATISGVVTTDGGGTLVGIGKHSGGISLGTSVAEGVQLVGIASGSMVALNNSWGTSVVNAIAIGVSSGYSGPALPGSKVIGVSQNSKGADIYGNSIGGTVTGFSTSNYWNGVQIESEVTTIDPSASISGVNANASANGNGYGVWFLGSPDLNGVIGAHSTHGAVGGTISSAFMNLKSASELSGTFAHGGLTDKVVYMAKSPADTRALYFNAADGKMYSEYDGGSFSDEVTVGDVAGWTGAAGALTLNGFRFETSAATALRIIGDCTITLNGENAVKSVSGGGVPSCGIDAGAGLTILGDGELTATAADTEAGSIGISANESITVGSAGSSPTVVAKGGNTSSGDSIGIAADESITVGGVVTATAGTVGSGNSTAIYTTHGFTVTGGKLTAQGKKYGVYSEAASTFSGGFIDLTGDTAALHSTGDITLTGMGARANGYEPASVNNTAHTFTDTDGNDCTNVLITPAKAVTLRTGTTYAGQTLTAADFNAPAGATLNGMDERGVYDESYIDNKGLLFTVSPDFDYDSRTISYTPKSDIDEADVGKTVIYDVSLDLDGNNSTSDDQFPLTLTFEVVRPTVSVAAQVGSLTYGDTAGSATFAVTAEHFATAPVVTDYTINWYSDAAGTEEESVPTGVTLTKTNTTTLTASITTAALAGDYYFKLTAIKGGNTATSGVVTLTVNAAPTPSPEDYATEITPNGKDFGSVTVGYSPIDPAIFTIENTGAKNLTGLAVALEGLNPDSFEKAGTVASTVYASVHSGPTTTTFTVNPISGLGAGAYTANIQITANGLTTINKPISFVVTTAPIARYTINLSASPTAGGTVTGGGTFDENTSRTVVAVASSGYHFVRWTEGGNEAGASATYTFDLTTNRNLMAVFEADTPTITFGTQPQNKTVTAGSITESLTAAASVSPSGTATLNWYACDAGGTINGGSLGTGGTFTIPTALTQGTHYYLCRATYTGATDANSSVATLTVNAAPTPSPEDYATEVTPNGKDFGSVTMGYSPIDPAIFTIENTGAKNLTGLAVALEGLNPDSFEKAGTVASTVYASVHSGPTTTTFTVNPISGLGAGAYTANIQITANGLTTINKPISFVVTTAPITRYTITFDANGGIVEPASATTGVGGALASLPTPTRSSYNFSGWFTAVSGGEQVTTSKVFTTNATIYARWTYSDGGSSSPSTTETPSTPSTTSTDSSSPSAVPVIVDGQSESIGTVTKTATTTTVVVDQQQLTSKVEVAAPGSSVEVPVRGSDSDTIVAQFVVQNVEDMASKQMTLVVTTEDVSFEIPTPAVDTAAVMRALEADNPADVPVSVTITRSDTAQQQQVNNTVNSFGGQVIGTPINYTVTASYGGRTVEVGNFNDLITRALEVTAEQAGKITTAIVYHDDGRVAHVPTFVTRTGEKYFALLKNFTNSIYALIYNEESFSDARGKWYGDTVTEMASRKVISGRGNNIFDGDANITRAEFATILVNALGLPTDGKGTVFNDVAASAWYCGTVSSAYEYGLITGRGEGKFDPNSNITRQEAMLMVQKAASLAGFKGTSGSLASFSDADSVSSWAKAAAEWNIGSSLIKGYENDTVRAQDNISRAESATLILKLLQKAELVDVRTRL